MPFDSFKLFACVFWCTFSFQILSHPLVYMYFLYVTECFCPKPLCLFCMCGREMLQTLLRLFWHAGTLLIQANRRFCLPLSHWSLLYISAHMPPSPQRLFRHRLLHDASNIRSIPHSSLSVLWEIPYKVTAIFLEMIYD